MIENVKELGAEFQLGPLGDREVLEQRSPDFDRLQALQKEPGSPFGFGAG